MMPTNGAGGLLQDPAFVAELEQAAQASGKTLEQAQQYAGKCLHEIEATPRESWLKPAAKMARFIYTRSYERELDINLEALDDLRERSKDHLLLFLWSHKSHMDSFVFLLSLYENRFRPLPLIFAGINMNFLGFGSLARRVGAIFLRRSFQEDPIYKLVFRSYIDYLIRNKMPLSWSIEGTRSRTGKLSPPKLGILNWVLESCQKEQVDKVLLVPVSIAFDRIAEIDDYVAIQRGEPKRKESLGWFFNYIFGMKQPYGKVYVRFAKPLALGEATTLSQEMSAAQGPDRGVVTRMGFEVCSRIEQITPIKSADVLTMVLLGANGRALTATEIHAQAGDIASLVRQRGLPAASGFSLEDEEQVRAAVLALQGSGLIRCFDKANVPVYYIPRARKLAAAYYRNTITHYFLNAALAEIGLASCALDIEAPGARLLEAKVLSLRDLYKFEFYYKPTPAFLQEVQLEADQRYPDWAGGDHSLQKLLREKPPRFGHAILRSITESYLIIAVSLLELGAQAVPDRKKFISRLMAQGEQMLLRRTISCESSVSQDLFSNGLRLVEHLDLLTGGGDLVSRREDYAQRVVSALSAINLLQRSYDSAWFSKLSAGKVSNLLGP
ncbi:MAG: 1-acyl-sn-glycerol-3-phosphate acyltransferase [Halieaceae bacterium]|jgi:glycerol-3-phosphate O-acyltransferase|nr:1-acyl-sn-glycerol-3-phosphate acyltransferase [Halieaceae bacterium]